MFQEKNGAGNNDNGSQVPFENDQSLSAQLQRCRNEIEHLSRQTCQMETQNSQLIIENETLNKHLKESQLKIEQLKKEKSSMNTEMNLLNKKLDKCKKKKQAYKNASHHASTAASLLSKSAEVQKRQKSRCSGLLTLLIPVSLACVYIYK